MSYAHMQIIKGIYRRLGDYLVKREAKRDDPRRQKERPGRSTWSIPLHPTLTFWTMASL
jgi:hypothetical protein